jgi:hypothetical protein
MPSLTSSHAVRRAPCRNGRVSSASTQPFAALGRGANHAQRRAVAGGRQRARVAMRQDARLVGHELRAIRAHVTAALDVFVVYLSALPPRVDFQLVNRGPPCAAAANVRFIRSIAQNS